MASDAPPATASEFWAQHWRRPPDGFGKLFPHPFLVEVTTQAYADARGFQTRSGNESFEEMMKRGFASDVRPASKIFPIAKRTAAFPDKVSVGRAKNTDLMIPDGDLSKLHAYFTREGEAWRLADADSKNGTFVNGRRLRAGESRALRDDDIVWFGPRLFYRFLQPLTLHARLAALPSPG